MIRPRASQGSFGPPLAVKTIIRELPSAFRQWRWLNTARPDISGRSCLNPFDPDRVNRMPQFQKSCYSFNDIDRRSIFAALNIGDVITTSVSTRCEFHLT